MKKEYMKPAMKVYEFEQKSQLLVGSGGEMNYIPGQQPDDKHLA